VNEEIRELFDRYAGEVDRHLPKKLQTDVGMEIRSMLEDSLEDRSRAEEREPDEEMAVAVLKELGPPSEVAASFAPTQYLIGPGYYPAFMMVLKIVLAVILVVNLFALVAALIRSDDFSVWMKPLSELASSAVGGLGVLVLIFALMERALPSPDRVTGEWDPRDLIKVRERDRVRPGQLIFAIGAGLMALILFSFFPDRIGIYNNRNGVWSFTPILTPAFALYLPWINIRLLLGLALNVVMLRYKELRPWSRYISLALSLFGLAIVYSMYVGPAVLKVTGRPDLDRQLFLVILISMVIGLVRKLIRWLRPEPYLIQLKQT
jgi:hypothetical protein